MFYISSIGEPFHIAEWRDTTLYNRIGITDSDDGVEEFYTNKQVYDFIEKDGIRIYGQYIYGVHQYKMFVFPFPIKKLNVKCESSILKELFDKNRKQHNGFQIPLIAAYLVSLVKGTEIYLSWSDRMDGTGQVANLHISLVKLDTDLWQCGGDCWCSSNKVDSNKVADALDYPSCCSTIKIKVS